MAPSAGQFLPGPVNTGDADAGVHVPERAGPGRRAQTPGGYPREASWSWPGLEPVTTPAARPAWPPAGRRWPVDDVGCLPQRAGYPLSRPDPLQLFGQLGDQLAQRRQVKALPARRRCSPPARTWPPGLCGVPGQPGGLLDQAAQPRPRSATATSPAGAGTDRRIRGSTRLRIKASISLRILRHHNHLTSRPWTAWPA